MTGKIESVYRLKRRVCRISLNVKCATLYNLSESE